MKLKNIEAIPVEHRARIIAIIDKHGIGQAAKFLGLSKHAMERASLGANVHRGTAAYLKAQIEARDAEGKNP